MKKFAIFIYGIVSYVVFLASFLYAIGFMGQLLVPKSINSGEASGMTESIIINLVLLSLFAVQHSVMARPAFKKWWTKIISPAIERSTYVLLTSLLLFLIFWKWQPMTTNVWNIEGETYVLIINIVFWIGWIIVLLSTFMINHFHLFGLDQVYTKLKSKPPTGLKFTEKLFYKIVRHPIMTGFIIAFWATPVMTQGHLLFAVVTTLYILIAVKYLEERDLKKELGDTYISYQKRVPMLIPFLKFGKKE
ncbi:hypothetical protein A9Q86_11930 [Flavobacteriales bacterium 33_180_T64]|nr:hypothetical protein A9Q86_11930 [Flavobacteriales bacterium 33_180_T64]